MHLAIESYLFTTEERLRVITSAKTSTLFENIYIHNNKYSFDVISKSPPKNNTDSFSLGKSESTQKKLEKDVFYSKKKVDTLTNFLASWYGKQNHYLQKHGHTSLYLVFGFLGYKRKWFPIIYLPVILQPGENSPFFTVTLFGSNYKFNDEFLSIADQQNLNLPELPKIHEKLELQPFLEQLDVEASKNSEIQLLKRHELQLAFKKEYKRTEKSERTQQRSPIYFTSGKSKNDEWLNLLDENPFLSTKYYSQIISGFKKNVHQIIQRSKTGLDDNKAIEILLIQILKDGNKTLIVTNDGVGTAHIHQFLKKYGLADEILNYFNIPDRTSLIQNLRNKLSFENKEAQITSDGLNTQDYKSILQYEQEIQESIGEAGISYIELLFKLENLEHAPDLSFQFENSKSLPQDKLTDWKNNITKYVELKATFSSPSSFSWSDLRSEASIDAAGLINIKRMLQKIDNLVSYLQNESLEIAKHVGLPVPQNLQQCELLIKHITFFLDHPKLYSHQLDTDWSPTPERVKELFSLLERTQKFKNKTKEFFNTEIIHEPLENLIPRLRKISLNFTRFFNWKYKKDVQRLANYAKNDTGDHDLQFWRHLSDARIYQKLRDEIIENNEHGSFYFGDFWQGANTDLNFCRMQVRWLKTFSDYCDKHSVSITPELKKILSGNKKIDSERVDRLARQVDLFLNTISVIKEFLPFTDESIFTGMEKVGFREISEDVQQKLDEISQISEWIEFKNLEERSDFTQLDNLLDEFHERDDISVDELPDVLLKCYYKSLQRDAKLKVDTSISDSVEEKAAQFSETITEKRSNTINQIKRSLLNKKLNYVRKTEHTPSLHKLQRELLKEHSYLPISGIINQTKEALLTYAPVWIIPPSKLEVLKDHFDDFDTIIVDEIENYNGELWNNTTSEQQIIGLSSFKKDSLNWVINKECPLFYRCTYKEDTPEQQTNLSTLKLSQIKIDDQQSSESVVPDKIINKTIEQNINPNANYRFWVSTKKQQTNFWLNYAKLVSRKEPANPKSKGYENDQKPQVLLLGDDIYNAGLAKHSFVFNSENGKQKKAGFGFKKTKSDNQNHLSVIKTTHSEITLIKTPDNKKDSDHFYKKLENSLRSENKVNSTFHQFLSDNVSNNWKVIRHPENPFEALLQHQTETGLTIYICSDTSAYFQGESLLLNYTLAKHNFSNVLFFPLHYYPNQIEHWFNKAQKKIKKVEKELFKGLHGLNKGKQDTKPDQNGTVKQPKLILPDWIPTYKPKSNIEFKPSQNSNESVTPNIDQLPDLDTYKCTDPVIMGHVKDFQSSSDDDIKSLVLELVKQEFPIHWRNTVRRILSYWHIFKFEISYGSRILDIIKSLCDEKKIFLKDECIYKDDTFKFALRDRSENLGMHRANEIPLDECETAIFEILKEFSPVKKDLLLAKAMQYMGFPHATAPLKQQYDKALLRMADLGYIAKSAEGIELSEELSDVTDRP